MQATSTPAESILKAFKGCSVAIVAGYGVALCYRAGLLQHVIPTNLYQTLVKKVDAIKARTEPPSGSEQYVVARRHLLTTYAYTVLGFACGGAGVAMFFRYPYVPIGPAIAATLMPALAIKLFPRKWMWPHGREALFAFASVACGYSLGPMSWITFDSLKTVGAVVGCTLVGASLPLFLTRGIVSYFFASQGLSYSLAVATSGWYASSPEDCNVALLMQIAGNISLGLFHTVPIIRKAVGWKGSLASLEFEEFDPVLEALQICGNVSYACWYAFRLITTFILYRITREDRPGASREETSHVRAFARTTLNIDRWSNIAASCFFLLGYVRLVTYLQRADTSRQFEYLRIIFKRLSPVALVR